MAFKKTVLLGLSGGVDSAVAALMLKQQGYCVIGAFIKSFSETKSKLTGECSWREDYLEAQKIASILGIKLVNFDFEKEYKNRVIQPMLKAYKRGITPNPDITCNTLIKFPLLWKAAKKIGANYIATGHYARIKKTSQGYELLAGKDKTKDQSYFLSELAQKDLLHTLFPLGSLTKEEVRQIAHKNNFPNADKPSTRGICFVGKVSMKKFLKKYLSFKTGQVVNPERVVIGTHDGSQLYTIGERVGPRIGVNLKNKVASTKWYVAAKNTKNNIITVAPENHPLLKRKEFLIHKMHFINQSKNSSSSLKVRIRHLGPLMSCTIHKKGSRWICRLKKPITGIADGQYAVFYGKNIVVASGEIRF